MSVLLSSHFIPVSDYHFHYMFCLYAIYLSTPTLYFPISISTTRLHHNNVNNTILSPQCLVDALGFVRFHRSAVSNFFQILSKERPLTYYRTFPNSNRIKRWRLGEVLPLFRVFVHPFVRSTAFFFACSYMADGTMIFTMFPHPHLH